MADEPKESKESKKPRIRKTETVREKAEKAQAPAKPKRIRNAASGAAKPIKAAGRGLQKEYHPIKLPDNKVGRFMSKRRHWIPSYFRKSWVELRQVTWPGRKESWKLVFAVFAFSVIFGTIIAIVDFGLDKIFRKLLLG